MATPRYDAVAETYHPSDDDLGRPVTRALLELAACRPGERALDLACGDGLIARELARSGARTTAIDLSSRLVERARTIEAEDPLGLTYQVADASTDRGHGDDVFDLVTCHFGLSDIDDLPATLRNVGRSLVDGGRFVFSILHPCFGGGDGVSGSWPADGSYRDERWWRATGERSTLRQRVGANHRILSTYLNTLIEHGLAPTELAEPPPEDAWAAARPDAARQPVYLVARCQRTSRDDTGIR